MPAASEPSTRVERERRLQELERDEKHFAEIEVVMLYVEEARERAARTAKSLRADDAEEHLVEAVERTAKELSDVGRLLRQGTYFAVPKEQLKL